MNILDTIIASKKEEVARLKKAKMVDQIEASPFFSRPVLSLKQSLLDPNKTGIIAEFKRKSPSKGVINENADVVEITRGYVEKGASGLSVLTDEFYFGGSEADLAGARVNEIPILRKDFVIDEFQVLESRAMGADAILLIAASLSVNQVKSLARLARSLQLEVLLELHAEEELGHICDEIDLVGINNRDLRTFVVDLGRSMAMAKKIPGGKLKIAESGIHSAEQVRLFRNNGYSGFLIGEQFMKEQDPVKAFSDFVDSL